MGIGGGTGIGGGMQPPQIRDSETTAFVEVSKKYILSMLPSDTLEVIPFTQGEYDEVFNYRAEPDRPMLHPLLHLRYSELPEIMEKETWQPLYEKLLDTLPPEIRARLSWENQQPFSERDPGYVALNQLFMQTAIAVVWLESAAQPPAPNSAEETRSIAYLALPYITLRTGIGLVESTITSAELWLNQIGPNDPDYDRLTHFIGDLHNLVEDFNALRKDVELGHENYVLTSRFSALADRFHQLDLQMTGTGFGEGLLLAKTTAGVLAMICSAWGLETGSSSLFIGLSIALTGIAEGTSELGIVGNAFHTILESISAGLNEAFPSGAQAEQAELEALDTDLTELRDF